MEKKRNCWVIPTDKPSRLLYFGTSKELTLQVNPATFRVFERSTQNIYITSDEEIKDGEYGICLNLVRKGFKSHQAVFKMDSEQRQAMEELGGQKKAEVLKVILTDDKTLIADGIQAIHDKFLEWFVNNPSCEFVEIVTHYPTIDDEGDGSLSKQYYTLNIPKEEPKQECNWSDIEEGCVNDECECERKETLEEASEKYFKKVSPNICFYDAVKFGAKWQAERMYSEEEVEKIAKDAYTMGRNNILIGVFNKWFEQFKKK